MAKADSDSGDESERTESEVPCDDAEGHPSQVDVTLSPLSALRSGRCRELFSGPVVPVVLLTAALALGIIGLSFYLGQISSQGSASEPTVESPDSDRQQSSEPSSNEQETADRSEGNEDSQEDSGTDASSCDEPASGSDDSSASFLVEQGSEILDKSMISPDGVVDQSLAQNAFDLFKKATESGDAEAFYYAGYCYYYGYGITKDYGRAYSSFLKAAESGDANGLAWVGTCLYRGEGVQQDRDKSYEYFSQSAQQGNAAGLNGLGNCYKHGYGVSQNDKKMIECYRTSADGGDDGGLLNLGACYYDGRGVGKDASRAVAYYTSSASLGNGLAQYYLAECYLDGDGVAADRGQASYWAYRALNNKRDTRAASDADALINSEGL